MMPHIVQLDSDQTWPDNSVTRIQLLWLMNNKEVKLPVLVFGTEQV